MQEKIPRKIILRAALAAALLLLALGGVVFFRALTFRSRQASFAPARDAGSLPPLPAAEKAAERLAAALRFRTISTGNPSEMPTEEFRRLHAHLRRNFPLVHAKLGREEVGELGVLYHWQGKSEGGAMLLSAHLDVVPASEASLAEWEEPPFSGKIANGFIYGRGAIDDKASALAILEATEALLAAGFQPERDVYFAFGHDEEVGGEGGAKSIASLLAGRNVKIDFILDEGSVITEAPDFGIAGPIALIGIGEKGFVDVELKVRADGGHSSMPPASTAIGILAGAIAKLDANPYPLAISGPFAAMLDYLGPEMPFGKRLALANRWLFGGFVRRAFEKRAATLAMMRTSHAATVVSGGIASNVLPEEATAIVNFRILPGETVPGVLARAKQIINDSRVAVAQRPGSFANDPPAVSSAGSDSFRKIAAAVRELVPGVVVAPYLTTGATDSRHYAGLTTNIYRFLPLRLVGKDLSRFHGVGERIGAEDYQGMIRFYSILLARP